MKFKYKAKAWGVPKILSIEVSKETDASVWVGGYRRAKKSRDCGYFDTFAEAKEFLQTEAVKRMDRAKYLLAAAHNYAKRVAKLSEDQT